MRVAIVHDWLVGGGAERVVLELHRMFPEAPIYTSYCTDEWRSKLDGKVVTGFLQRWPFSKLRKFLPVLRIWWFSRLDFTGYDLVISSSGNGEAKGIKVPERVKHVCYCHAPTHFYWRHYDQYLREPGFGLLNPVIRLCLRLLANPLRRWDYQAAQRPDVMIANSGHTQAEIKKYYDRESVVIHPPVDIERFANSRTVKRNGFITAGRLVPYKRTDIIVEACAKLGLPLKVIGSGPQLEPLKRLAGPTVEFLGWVDSDDMPKLFAEAEAFIFAAYEDFGITPVEAMAAGTPVIAYSQGGAKDYVQPGKTGLFFEQQAADSLISALKEFDTLRLDSRSISFRAEAFSPGRFRKQIQQLVDKSD